MSFTLQPLVCAPEEYLTAGALRLLFTLNNKQCAARSPEEGNAILQIAPTGDTGEPSSSPPDVVAPPRWHRVLPHRVRRKKLRVPRKLEWCPL